MVKGKCSLIPFTEQIKNILWLEQKNINLKQKYISYFSFLTKYYYFAIQKK